MSETMWNSSHARIWLIAAVFSVAFLSPVGSFAQSAEDLFKDCATCHSREPGKNGVGPSLHGLVGRRIATVEGFRYSNILKAQTVVWNESLLDRFIADPQAMFRGNKMPYSGMSDAAARKVLVDWLVSQR